MKDVYAASASTDGVREVIGEVDPWLAQASELEAAQNLPALAAMVDQLLAAGHCNPALALLLARSAGDMGREGQALELILRELAKADAHAPRTVSSLHFAAAQLLDKLRRYDEAFAHATHANAPWAASYDPRHTEALVSKCIEIFSKANVRRIKRASRSDPTPVFIVGMVRSGSTLLEQVLATHPQVFGGGELSWVNRLWLGVIGRVAASETPDEPLFQLSSSDADAVASEYLGALRGLHPTATRIVDKTLANFMHLGLIWMLFPGARVIHSRRDPLDVGISAFLTDFADILPFTCSLPALGHFHRHVDRLMAHWKRVLDLPILEVEYEAVVRDLEGQTRRMLKFLDLPWDERCLQFHQNPRRVATASWAQVRRPIFRASVGRWRHYDKWLGPLRNALRDR